MTMLIVGSALVFGSGVVTGWRFARRATDYMLGGRS
jgi:hypothetical protein